MVDITIPGDRTFSFSSLVCDFNGTLAVDGRIVDGVAERFHILAPKLALYVVTADTHGTARRALAGLPCTVKIIPRENEDTAKMTFLEEIGAAAAVAVGNGMNDRLMLKGAGLGIAVFGGEGTAVPALTAADIVVSHITDALDLVITPARLVATLRR